VYSNPVGVNKFDVKVLSIMAEGGVCDVVPSAEDSTLIEPSGASVCVIPEAAKPAFALVESLFCADLGDRLGLYVYVPMKGCGKFSLPAIKDAVRGSLGSSAEPTNC